MNWIQTHNGIKFYPLNPDPDKILIDDIAHALSNICRFNGHCKEFYSVAQHSCLVAAHLPNELKLLGLLHDASEAYICDIPSPLKNEYKYYKEIELNLQYKIYVKFNAIELYISHPNLLAGADIQALATEKRDLMAVNNLKWHIDERFKPFDEIIIPEPPKIAYKNFCDAIRTELFERWRKNQ